MSDRDDDVSEAQFSGAQPSADECGEVRDGYECPNPIQHLANARARAFVAEARVARAGMTHAQARLADELSERDLSQHVVNLARMLGWRVMRTPTWRPTGTDPGYPDLTLARDGRVVFVELKRTGGRLSAAQQAWLAALPPDGEHVTVCVWSPAHWYGGLVEEVLR